MNTAVHQRRRSICVFDTAIATDNLGDHIIMDAVWDVIDECIGLDVDVERVATHTYMPRELYSRLRSFELGIVGGTNILKSHMFVRANWRLRPYDALFLRNVVLLGVGWQQYQGEIDIFSRALFRRILSARHLHSVRDEYTLDKLGRRMTNVVYTACPTLWQLTAERCAAIPVTQAEVVVLSVTYYRPSTTDAELARMLQQRYARVVVWCQQPKDRAYFEALGLDGPFEIIGDIDAYNRLLASTSVDVVGTRLHGGIRALQRGRRALILAIDNRAVEMARTTDIPVVDRQDLAGVRGWIDASAPVAIKLPWDGINAWKQQFRRHAAR